MVQVGRDLVVGGEVVRKEVVHQLDCHRVRSQLLVCQPPRCAGGVDKKLECGPSSRGSWRTARQRAGLSRSTRHIQSLLLFLIKLSLCEESSHLHASSSSVSRLPARPQCSRSSGSTFPGPQIARQKPSIHKQFRVRRVVRWMPTSRPFERSDRAERHSPATHSFVTFRYLAATTLERHVLVPAALALPAPCSHCLPHRPAAGHRRWSVHNLVHRGGRGALHLRRPQRLTSRLPRWRGTSALSPSCTLR